VASFACERAAASAAGGRSGAAAAARRFFGSVGRSERAGAYIPRIRRRPVGFRWQADPLLRHLSRGLPDATRTAVPARGQGAVLFDDLPFGSASPERLRYVRPPQRVQGPLSQSVRAPGPPGTAWFVAQPA